MADEIGRFEVGVDLKLDQLVAHAADTRDILQGIQQSLSGVAASSKATQAAVTGTGATMVGFAATLYVVKEALAAIKAVYAEVVAVIHKVKAVFDSTVGAAADFASELVKQSAIIGASVEGMQALRAGMTVAGSSASMGTMIFRRLAMAISQMVGPPMQGAKEAFKELGISVLTTSGQLRSADEILTDLARVFGEMEEGPRRTALGMAIFGRQASEILNMFKELGSGGRDWQESLRQTGLVLDHELIERAAQLDKWLNTLKMQGGQAWRAIGLAAAPAFEPLAKELVRLRAQFILWVQDNRKGIEEVARRLAQGVETMVRFLSQLLEKLRQSPEVVHAASMAFRLLVAIIEASVISIGALVTGFGYLFQMLGSGMFMGPIKELGDGLVKMGQAWTNAFLEARAAALRSRPEDILREHAEEANKLVKRLKELEAQQKKMASVPGGAPDETERMRAVLTLQRDALDGAAMKARLEHDYQRELDLTAEKERTNAALRRIEDEARARRPPPPAPIPVYEPGTTPKLPPPTGEAEWSEATATLIEHISALGGHLADLSPEALHYLDITGQITTAQMLRARAEKAAADEIRRVGIDTWTANEAITKMVDALKQERDAMLAGTAAKVADQLATKELINASKEFKDWYIQQSTWMDRLQTTQADVAQTVGLITTAEERDIEVGRRNLQVRQQSVNTALQLATQEDNLQRKIALTREATRLSTEMQVYDEQVKVTKLKKLRDDLSAADQTRALMALEQAKKDNKITEEEYNLGTEGLKTALTNRIAVSESFIGQMRAVGARQGAAQVAGMLSTTPALTRKLGEMLKPLGGPSDEAQRANLRTTMSLQREALEIQAKKARFEHDYRKELDLNTAAERINVALRVEEEEHAVVKIREGLRILEDANSARAKKMIEDAVRVEAIERSSQENMLEALRNRFKEEERLRLERIANIQKNAAEEENIRKRTGEREIAGQRGINLDMKGVFRSTMTDMYEGWVLGTSKSSEVWKNAWHGFERTMLTSMGDMLLNKIKFLDEPLKGNFTDLWAWLQESWKKGFTLEGLWSSLFGGKETAEADALTSAADIAAQLGDLTKGTMLGEGLPSAGDVIAKAGALGKRTLLGGGGKTTKEIVEAGAGTYDNFLGWPGAPEPGMGGGVGGGPGPAGPGMETSGVIAELGKLGEIVKDGFKQVGGWIADGAAKMLSELGGLGKWFGDGLKLVGKGLTKLTSELLNSLGDVVTTIMSEVGTPLVSILMSLLTSTTEDLVKLIVTIITTIFGVLEAILSVEIEQAIRGLFGQTGGYITGAGGLVRPAGRAGEGRPGGGGVLVIAHPREGILNPDAADRVGGERGVLALNEGKVPAAILARLARGAPVDGRFRVPAVAAPGGVSQRVVERMTTVVGGGSTAVQNTDRSVTFHPGAVVVNAPSGVDGETYGRDLMRGILSTFGR